MAGHWSGSRPRRLYDLEQNAGQLLGLRGKQYQVGVDEVTIDEHHHRGDSPPVLCGRPLP